MRRKFLLSLIALFCLAGGSAWAQTFTQGNLKYTVNGDKTVSVIKKDNNISGDIVIPATVTYGGVTYTVTEVPAKAFNETSITSVTIPATVTSLGEQAFASCSALGNIIFQDGDEEVLWIDNKGGNMGTFYDSNAQKTIYIGRNLALTDTNAPFNNAISVEFGSKVTYINDNLFRGADLLSNVKMADGITSIGSYAFCSAGDDASVSEMKVQLSNNLTSIGDKAFENCVNLKSITLPQTLTNIYGEAFAGTGISTLTVPASVESLPYRGFASCQNLKRINIEDGDEVLWIDNGGGSVGTFYDCPAQKTIYIGRNLALTDTNAPFNNTTSVEFGNKVTYINDNLFYNSDMLSNVKMSNSITTIGSGAFQSSGDAASVSEMKVQLSSKLTSIGGKAFESCVNLKSITLPQTLTNIYDAAFASTGISSLSVPASVTSLPMQGFASCQNLKRIVIEDGDEYLWIDSRGGNMGTFYGSNAQKTIYIGRNLALTDTNAPFNNTTSVEFGNKVTVITACLFSGSKLLSNVKMSNSIHTIGSDAFSYAGTDASVSELHIQMSGIVSGIGAKAFYGCSTLKSITLPQTLLGIGEEAFACSGLTSISIPASVTNLPARGFASCTALQRIVFEDTDEYVWVDTRGGSVGTFYDCPTPKSVYLGRRLLLNDNNSPFSNVTSVEFGERITEIPSILFGNATELTEVIVPWETPISIEESAFSSEAYQNATLFVPNGTINAYKTHAVWKKFLKIYNSYYTVTVVGGGITVSNTKPHYGEDVTVTIIDDPDRMLVSLKVNGTDVTSQVSGGKYVIKNITQDVTVEGTFKATKEFITLTEGYAVFSCPQDLDFSESNLCAYIVSGVNKNTHQVLMTRVFDVPAGTGLYLIGTPGQTYKIPYSESYSIYKNFLVANLTKGTVDATTGSYTNYAFGTEGGEPGFYPINGSTTLQAQTAYLQLPTSFVEAGVKMSIILEEDLIDGINEVNDEWLMVNGQSIYNLAGQRLGKMQKGINIVGGKKILK